MFRTVPLPIIRSSFIVHPAMVCVIQVCSRLTSRIRMEHMTYVIQVCGQLTSRIRIEQMIYVIQVCGQLTTRIRMEHMTCRTGLWPAYEQDQDGTYDICHTGLWPVYDQDQDGTYMSHRSVASLRAGSGWNILPILILLVSCLQTCMTYHCWAYSE